MARLSSASTSSALAQTSGEVISSISECLGLFRAVQGDVRRRQADRMDRVRTVLSRPAWVETGFSRQGEWRAASPSCVRRARAQSAETRAAVGEVLQPCARRQAPPLLSLLQAEPLHECSRLTDRSKEYFTACALLARRASTSARRPAPAMAGSGGANALRMGVGDGPAAARRASFVRRALKELASI